MPPGYLVCSITGWYQPAQVGAPHTQSTLPPPELDLGAGLTPFGLCNVAVGLERKRATADLPAYAVAAGMRFGNVIGDLSILLVCKNCT